MKDAVPEQPIGKYEEAPATPCLFARMIDANG